VAQGNASLRSSLASLSAATRAAAIAALSEADALALCYDWSGFLARPKQLPPPGDWSTWLILAGRGFGKTRTGAEWVRSKVEPQLGGNMGRVAIIGPTAHDVRAAIVEGESGILAISPPWFRPEYESSRSRITWPNGAHAELFSAEEPERLRNMQQEIAWCDELRAWKYPQETWDMLQFGLRLGSNPQAVVTTTPRPIALIQSMLKDTTTVVTGGTTLENAENISPKALAKWLKKYGGTRLGRQELEAEMLEDMEGALWTLAMLDATRVDKAPELVRIVVGVDPSGGSDDDADEQGIVVDGKGADGHLYVLADRSCRMSPAGWGHRAVQAFVDFEADEILYERNYGGDMVESNIKAAAKAMGVSVKTKAVTATRGKRVRAEPVAALWEQGRGHIVGSLGELEDQMLGFTPEGMKESPDRADAMVWGGVELMGQVEGTILSI
jgi:phage terminase large subunit-like protein